MNGERPPRINHRARQDEDKLKPKYPVHYTARQEEQALLRAWKIMKLRQQGKSTLSPRKVNEGQRLSQYIGAYLKAQNYVRGTTTIVEPKGAQAQRRSKTKSIPNVRYRLGRQCSGRKIRFS